MSTPIVLFLVFGAAFGLATYRWRHLFSEGPTKPPAPGARNALDGRLMWAAVCTPLWPVMVLTGVHSLWRLARVSRRG